jgi:hypothetical protein
LIEFRKDDGGRGVVAGSRAADAKDQESARLLGKAFSWPGSVRCDRRFPAQPGP